MRSSIRHVFSLHVNLGARELFSQATCKMKRSWTANVLTSVQRDFSNERGILISKRHKVHNNGLRQSSFGVTQHTWIAVQNSSARTSCALTRGSGINRPPNEPKNQSEETGGDSLSSSSLSSEGGGLGSFAHLGYAATRRGRQYSEIAVLTA